MSSPNTRSRKRVSIQDIQQFHQRLQNYLSELQTPSNLSYTPQHDVYDYIHQNLKGDIRRHLLKFEPEPQQYQQFTEIYLKCTQIIIQFIVKCSNQYYKYLLLCLRALLGFAPSPMQCEIFVRSNYHKNQTKQAFTHVQAPMTPQPNAYHQTRGYNKRNKNKFNSATPLDTTSNCQLSVLDAFYHNIAYFVKQMKSNIPSKFGVFDLQKVLLILYQSSKYTNVDIRNKYYSAHAVHQMLLQWVTNVDETSFEPPFIGDESEAYAQLFTTMRDMFDQFIKKHSSSKIKVDRDLLHIKLLFVTKLLTCNFISKTMDRRVQALSLMKSVLDTARSDDNKYRNNNETNEWSTKSHSKSHQKQRNNPANHTNTKSGGMLRDKCSEFILKQNILETLMAPNYVHKNLLSRLQPIIDVLCETNQMKMDTIRLLWSASANKHSTELIQFDKMYLSLSKQLPTSLCTEFYELIDERLVCHLKVRDQIEESHLEFAARFTSNYIDKCKHGSAQCYGFQGIDFLKNYAINFRPDSGIANTHLRRVAFKQIQMILQKQSMHGHIEAFIIDTLQNMNQHISIALHLEETRSHLGHPHGKKPAFDAIDVTYCIQGIDELLRTKFVGRTNHEMYGKVADTIANQKIARSLLDLMVTEITYWYWYCSPSSSQRNKDFKIRFNFMRTIAQKTHCVVCETHVHQLTTIPDKEKMSFYNHSTLNPNFNETIRGMHHKQLEAWLNECVTLNQNDKTRTILDKKAIKSIFYSRFKPNMDFAKFKSWLAYFHDLNYDVYDLQTQQYTKWYRSNCEIVGLEHMKKVIENSTNMNVIVAMMDEMIKLNAVDGLDDKYDGVHMSPSAGISRLLVDCNNIFEKYGRKVVTEHNQTSSDFKHNILIMRYTLLLRRIMENRIGKSFKFAKDNRIIKVQVLYRQYRKPRNQYRTPRNPPPPPRFSVLELNGKENDTMIAIRKKIAGELNQEPPRMVQLYRKYKDRFILMEEIALSRLTYNDLGTAKKYNSNKKTVTATIELEYSIGCNPQSHDPSLAARVAKERDRFVNLKLLLTANRITTALSAYYVLRYLPMNDDFLNELIQQCYDRPREYFHPNRPLLNIYNLDMLSHYADMKCISQQERQKKEKVMKHFYHRGVFDVLFDLFVDDASKWMEFSSIHSLLWIEQFNRLCFMFHDLRVPPATFQTPKQKRERDEDGFRVLRGYRNQSDKMMHAVMDALRHILTAKPSKPKDTLSLYDITLPNHSIHIKSCTIVKCFTIAINLITNKAQYLGFKRQQHNTVDDDELEEIFLNGLKNLGNLQNKIFDSNPDLNLRIALYQGIERFGDVIKRKPEYLARILHILVGILPTDYRRNNLKHPSRFFKLLTDLMGGNDDYKRLSQPFIPPILGYVFGRLRHWRYHKKSSAASLLNTANILYAMMDASCYKEVDVKSHIELLINTCLFGSDENKTLLCPSGTVQREKAFDLLDTILQRQPQWIGILLNPLFHHLGITSDSIVINENDAMDFITYPQTDDEKKTSSPRVDNRRQYFVGLVNLGSTCYLNAILQQLFMIPSFTNEILSLDSTPLTPPQPISLLFELQRLLLSLRESQRKYVNTRKFCNAVRIDSQPITAFEQQDCHEALNALLAELEENLKHLGVSTRVLEDHFSCALRYITECDNGHRSTRAEKQNVLDIPVRSDEGTTLYDALDTFVEADVLDGDNKYNCEQCNCKVTATRRLTIFEPPKQLILGLKRFDYNVERNERVKINTRFEFDPVIHIRKYLYSNFVEESKYDGEEDKYIYDLVGIVIHQGTANSGHYYAYIKDRSPSNSDHNNNKEEWYQFDDKQVTKKDFNAIQKEAFGGSSVVPINDNASQKDKNKNNVWNKQRIPNKAKQASVEVLSQRSAYVLFYEQRAVKKEKEKQKRKPKQSETMHKPWNNVKYLSDQYARITSENDNLFRQQTVYDAAFVKFMKSMYTKQQSHIQSHDVLLRFVFNVVPIQIHNKKEIQWWWRTLEDAVQRMTPSQLEGLITSTLFPSYLMNIFGKYRNSHNRVSAALFLRHLIQNNLAKQLQSDDLLDSLLCALITVVNKWKATVLTRSSMREIIELMDCIWQCHAALIAKHRSELIRALKRLMEKDQTYQPLLPQSISKETYETLLASDSNLNVTAVCDLMWRLIEMSSNDEDTATLLKDETFCRVLIARDYCESQVKIIQYIVRNNTRNVNDLDTFQMIVKLIDSRMHHLDFYDVYGALNALNGLFMDREDIYITEKLQTQCLKYHLKRILSNQRFWKITQVSLLCLSDLCKKNIVVQEWIRVNCFVELEQLAPWVQKNKKFQASRSRGRGKRRNQQYQSNNYQMHFHRFEPRFPDKNKNHKGQNRLQQWKHRMMSKLKAMSNLQNPKESPPIALNIIRGKQQ